MSIEDYKISRLPEFADVPFYALLMATMRRADTDNAARLRSAFPAVWSELHARYRAPRGVLPGDQPLRVET